MSEQRQRHISRVIAVSLAEEIGGDPSSLSAIGNGTCLHGVISSCSPRHRRVFGPILSAKAMPQECHASNLL